MQTPRAMQCCGGMPARTFRICPVRLRLVVVAILTILFGFGASVKAQIGNLDWASGKKATKYKRQVDYEQTKLQFFMEPAIGNAKYDYEKSSESVIMVDLGIGGIYRVYRSPAEGMKFDIAAYFQVGANMADFDIDGLRLLGSAAPEVGVVLPSKSSLTVRPFASFGPGISVLHNGYAYAGGFGANVFDFDDGNQDEKTVKMVWVLRAGVEVGSKTGPLSGSIGVKRIGRGETKLDSDRKFTEADLLFMLGIRFKLAL